MEQYSCGNGLPQQFERANTRHIGGEPEYEMEALTRHRQPHQQSRATAQPTDHENYDAITNMVNHRGIPQDVTEECRNVKVNTAKPTNSGVFDLYYVSSTQTDCRRTKR